MLACVHAMLLQSCLTLCNPVDYSPLGSSLRGISSGKNTGVGCHAFPQGIFLTPGIKPVCFLHLLPWQMGPLPLSPSGKPHNTAYVFLKITVLCKSEQKTNHRAYGENQG